jgi:NAD(P)-dependent dehydrogenase (short-subunit alcohol dehydrogenase family)
MMDTYFKGKVAVVTGAGGVICSAVSKSLAQEGMTVILVGRTMSKLEKVASEIKANGGTCACYECNVQDQKAVNELAETIIAAYGKVDYLVNGAGGNNSLAVPSIAKFDPRELEEDRPEGIKGLYNVDMEAFESVIQINTMGTVYPILAFARYMVKEGSGSIVNFASMNTYRPLSRVPAYAIAKAGVSNFTQWLAAYLAPAGIRVNAVAPGFFVNERSKKLLTTPDGGLTPRGQHINYNTPMHRFGEAKELLGCVNWLVNDQAASFVTGITVPVDGGFLSSAGL